MKSWVITGGIGSGKSSFCDHLSRLAADSAIRIISADRIVHEAYEISDCRSRIAEAVALEYDCLLSPTEFRAQVRSAIQGDEALRKKLEAILHPIVWERRDTMAGQAKSEGIKVLVAEIPLYYETGAALAADQVIVVAASRGVQVSRLQSKRALDARASQDMLAMQMPLEQKIERADVVIWNDGSVSALENQAHLLLRQANLL